MSKIQLRECLVLVILCALFHGLASQTTTVYKPQPCCAHVLQTMATQATLTEVKTVLQQEVATQTTLKQVQATLAHDVASQDRLNDVMASLQAIEANLHTRTTASVVSVATEGGEVVATRSPPIRDDPAEDGSQDPRCGGVSLVLRECSGRLTNVASIAHGGTCLVSSEYSSAYICQFAIDGNIHTEWASRGQGVGAWLRIWFARPSAVRLVRIMQRSHRLEHFKEVLLEFSDSSPQQFTLTRWTGSMWNDISARWWDSFATNPTLSQFLKIEAVSVYTTYNNGFREVEVWANEQ